MKGEAHVLQTAQREPAHPAYVKKVLYMHLDQLEDAKSEMSE